MFQELDAAKAEAAVAADRLKILADIEASTGTQQLNHLIKKALVDSTVAEADRAHLSATPGCGATQLECAATLTKSGRMLYMYGQFHEAEALYREALKLRKEELEEEHVDIATSLGYLGTCLSEQGRQNDAEPLLTSAADMSSRLLGRDHKACLQAVNNLASCLYSQYRYEEAESLFRNIVEAKGRTVGADHVDAMEATSNLAVCMDAQQRYAAAEPLHRAVLRVRVDANDNTTHADFQHLSMQNMQYVYFMHIVQNLLLKPVGLIGFYNHVPPPPHTHIFPVRRFARPLLGKNTPWWQRHAVILLCACYASDRSRSPRRCSAKLWRHTPQCWGPSTPTRLWT